MEMLKNNFKFIRGLFSFIIIIPLVFELLLFIFNLNIETLFSDKYFFYKIVTFIDWYGVSAIVGSKFVVFMRKYSSTILSLYLIKMIVCIMFLPIKAIFNINKNILKINRIDIIILILAFINFFFLEALYIYDI